ncbi:MAG TPA: MFS transporter [Candidatus Binatia bacterium]|jgi:predicted MFS family arabinose efflux permease|nr:MFS transporter [Candidatus Binatia bacterium]
MFSRQLKTGYFVLEGLNSFATVYYFYYLYFFMQKEFGFSTKANLALAALNGGTYAACAWWGGRFAQRFGYFTALKVGFLVMMSALAIGGQVRSAAGQIVVMVVTVVGMCFTWPTLEALISEGEPRAGLQHMVGLYNVVWAGTAAVANFCGGAMLEKFGSRSLFYVPAAIQATQLGLTFWLQRQARQRMRLRVEQGSRQSVEPLLESNQPIMETSGAVATGQRPVSQAGIPSVSDAKASPGGTALKTDEPSLVAPARADQNPSGHALEAGPHPKATGFLRMAWLANPFAYIALNTLIAGMPGVARRLELSTMLAGFCGSVWCFARVAAFLGLWFWNGWHYRFRWLLLAYLVLVGTFTTILLAPNLALLISAQILFGGTLGLIYYSSLFYSMDLSQTKGEHGGIHEAVIGLGNCAGPAVGAAALQFLPTYANSGALAVTLLLLCGLAALLGIWRRGQ